MARDLTAYGSGTTTASKHARADDILLTSYVSSISVRETAASTAVVKLRDSVAVPATSSIVDGATGSVTVGSHFATVTAVTKWGESVIGSAAVFTAAGSKHATITFAQPAYTSPDAYLGLNIYWSKAGAPAITGTPTNAQWFLILANPTATLTSAMNAIALPQASLTVNSTTSFAASGRISVATTYGTEIVSYTSVDATHFLGCTGGRGIMATSGAVTQPMIPDATTTTYDMNIADASVVNTRPPAIDLSGRPLIEFSLAASESAGTSFGPNVKTLYGGGGAYVEINSGTVTWDVSGE